MNLPSRSFERSQEPRRDVRTLSPLTKGGNRGVMRYTKPAASVKAAVGQATPRGGTLERAVGERIGD